MTDKYTKEYMEKLGQMKLSDSARARIKENLDSYADFHAVSTDGVRTLETSRSSKQVSQTPVWQTALLTINKKTMHIFAVIAVMLIGGGTSLAAQGSVPGEFLYPVKVNVNENVRSALAIGADAEAELQADLLAERVAEAEELQATGRLSGTLATRVEGDIASQYERALAANAAADADAKTDTKLSVSLGRLANLSTTGNVAINTKMMAFGDDSTEESMAMRADSDMAVTSQLAAEPVNVNQIHENTTVRVESLRALLKRHQGEIRAEVYAEFIATLDRADRLLMSVMLQSSLDRALEIAFEATELVGTVESELSLMGQVKIDQNTGAIVDIDFSRPPATEPDRGLQIDPMPLPMPPEMLDGSGSAGGGVDGTVHYGDDMIETTSNLEATSQISL